MGWKSPAQVDKDACDASRDGTNLRARLASAPPNH